MGIASIAGAIADPSQLAAMFGFEPVLIGPMGFELTIDVLESEAPDYGFEITRDPVECGSDITDHIETKPPTVTLDCVFTDFQASMRNIAAAAINPNIFIPTWRAKKDALYLMKDMKQLVNVSTPNNWYGNYLIEDIAPLATSQSGDCFRFRITLTSVNLVASVIGYIDPLLLPADLMPSTADAGGAAGKSKGPSNKGKAPEGSSQKTGSAGNTADAYGY